MREAHLALEEAEQQGVPPRGGVSGGGVCAGGAGQAMRQAHGLRVSSDGFENEGL
jgi:hypothetical protein